MDENSTRKTTLLEPYKVIHKRKKLENRIAKLKMKIEQAKRKLYRDVQSRCPHPFDKQNRIDLQHGRTICELCGMIFE